MSKNIWTIRGEKNFNHLISCMNTYSYGDKEYELAKKIFLFYLKESRGKYLSDKENFKNDKDDIQ